MYDNLSREWLLRYYLESQTSGFLADFNKKNFPQDYKQMFKDLQFLNALNEEDGIVK